MDEDTIVVASNKPSSGGQTGTMSRTPTIYEALPFTPLSSIVPFTPGMLAFTCDDPTRNTVSLPQFDTTIS